MDIYSTTVRMLQDYFGDRKTGSVFQTSNGTPLDNCNINYQVLKPICAELGIKPGTMHAFRHGRVSHMRQNSVPADLVQRQVGHSNLRTTSGYTHFSQQFVRDTVKRLSQ